MAEITNYPPNKPMAVDRPKPEEVFRAVEESIRYNFHNRLLLEEALTHSSFSNEMPVFDGMALRDNERLEFLGDAVIGLVVARALMDQFPGANEGRMSRWRSSLVSRRTLAEMAGSLQLGERMFLGRGERRTGGAEKRSILAGVFESLIGAVYLDSGIETAEDILRAIYAPWFESLSGGGDKSGRLMDQKTHLQEKVQQRFRTTPEYRVVRAWGAEHEKNFCVEIILEGKIVSSGQGRSKKEAEQQAASLALEILEF